MRKWISTCQLGGCYGCQKFQCRFLCTANEPLAIKSPSIAGFILTTHWTICEHMWALIWCADIKREVTSPFKNVAKVLSALGRKKIFVPGFVSFSLKPQFQIPLFFSFCLDQMDEFASVMRNTSARSLFILYHPKELRQQQVTSQFM